MPDVTVVIPTRDRWDVLARTLAGLRRQDLGGVRAEVVVVDNGSRERPELAGVRVVVEAAPGAAAARNRGIAEARGRLVLFIGDDCIPADEHLVRGHVEAHVEGTVRAVTGRIEWDPAVERTEVMDWLERSGHMVDMERLRREPPGPETFYTGNVSVPRAALLECAGFDQRFSGYGFEDLELALRLADRGVAFGHRPDLGVLHSHRYGIERSLERMTAVGRGGRLLHAIHDHRRPLPGPPAGRPRLALGHAFARVRRLAAGPPRALPRPARDLWLRAAHLGAFAAGYSADPLDDHPARRGYGAVPHFSGEPRPAVSVVVPFLGSAAEGRALVEALGRLRLGEGDEVVVADNGGGLASVRPGGAAAPLRAVTALAERSSYYARNVGAEAARNEWLLFLDADTRPPASLLDDYFREPVGERCGAVAGAVVAGRGQRALAARYAASRRYLSQAAHLRDVHRPYAITANLLVRRSAWAEVGGFFEGLRSGGDQDFCWRIQDAGWTLDYREPAAVEHLHRERVRPLLRQMARYSAAIAWMERRAPGSSPRPRVTRRLARSLAGAATWAAAGRGERAAFKLLDGAVVLAEGAGYLMSNDAAPGPDAPAPPQAASAAPAPPQALLVAEFPTAAAAELARPLAARGPLAIEAARRPERPDREAARELRARFAEDDGILRRAAALAALAALGARARVAPLREVAAPARRLRRAGVGEVRSDPDSRERAALIAAVLGVPARP
ncbi:MAG TPA: glycosyltransferase [Thermoleophilaceae bacterium]